MTFPRYTQFGTKLSPLFGFAKSSKYKTKFKLSLIPKLLVACVTGGLFLSKLRLNRKFFTLLLASSNFHVCDFRFVIFNILFFNYLLFALKFCAKNFQFLLFSFLLADSNFHTSAFQVSVRKFQFSSFGFSGFNFSSFCRQVPIFTLLLVNFLRKQMLIF